MIAIENEETVAGKIMEIELESAKKDGKMIRYNFFNS